MSIKHIQRIYKLSVYYMHNQCICRIWKSARPTASCWACSVCCCWICSFVCVALLHYVLYISWAGTHRFIPIWSESIFVQAQSRSYEQTHMQIHAPSHTHTHTPTPTHLHTLTRTRAHTHTRINACTSSTHREWHRHALQQLAMTAVAAPVAATAVRAEHC